MACSLKNGWTILIPTWNNLKYLTLCVESLRTYSAYNHEILVFANGCVDGTSQWLEQNRVKFLASETNLGICPALNRIAKIGTRDWISYFNDDHVALPGWDKAIVDYYEQSGLPENSWLSSISIEGFGKNEWFLAGKQFDFGSEPENLQIHRLLNELPVLKLVKSNYSGCLSTPHLFMRRYWDQIDGFPEDYTTGFGSEEEVAKKLWDICGFRNYIGIGSSLVYHFGSRSTKRAPSRQSGKHIFQKKYGISMTEFHQSPEWLNGRKLIV